MERFDILIDVDICIDYVDVYVLFSITQGNDNHFAASYDHHGYLLVTMATTFQSEFIFLCILTPRDCTIPRCCHGLPVISFGLLTPSLRVDCTTRENSVPGVSSLDVSVVLVLLFSFVLVTLFYGHYLCLLLENGS